MSFAAVILAAGRGTRMKSKLAKVLHPLAGKPMIEYAVEAAQHVGVARSVVVIGHQGAQIRALLGERVEYAAQPELKGTGDAVRCAAPLLRDATDHVLIIYGDMPLVLAETLRRLMAKHAASGATLTMLTLTADDPMGFGRIVRDAAGNPVRIVEQVEATPQELAIRELNPGVYCFAARWLWENLPSLEPSRTKGEYYLTDLLERAVQQGVRVETETIDDVAQAIGINTRVQLSQAEHILRDRIRERVMLDGATLADPVSTYIDADVEIGPDTVILPNTYLYGKTRIGSDCRIGPGAMIHDSIIGNACTIGPSLIESATVLDSVEIGPFCHLRPNAYLSSHVHLGNYAEVKNSRLGEYVHMGHFSYIGDAEVGAHTNIGAGTITANYDGSKKHKTIIGEHAFIGSDTIIRAPVTIGARARTGAGAVVTKDIPSDTLAVGVPARIIRKLTDAGNNR